MEVRDAGHAREVYAQLRRARARLRELDAEYRAATGLFERGGAVAEAALVRELATELRARLDRYLRAHGEPPLP